MPDTVAIVPDAFCVIMEFPMLEVPVFRVRVFAVRTEEVETEPPPEPQVEVETRPSPAEFPIVRHGLPFDANDGICGRKRIVVVGAAVARCIPITLPKRTEPSNIFFIMVLKELRYSGQKRAWMVHLWMRQTLPSSQYQ